MANMNGFPTEIQLYQWFGEQWGDELLAVLEAAAPSACLADMSRQVTKVGEERLKERRLLKLETDAAEIIRYLESYTGKNPTPEESYTLTGTRIRKILDICDGVISLRDK